MERFDTIIIGGGPAGSTLARSLTHQGLRTLVLDKQNFPRDKTCAGWVTPAVLDALQIKPSQYSLERVMQPIYRFRIGMMGHKAVENDHGDTPVSYGIRRCEFDDYLLRRSGATLALGEKLSRLEPVSQGQWQVNGRYQAPLVVGAGGHFCPVAARMGDGPGRHETAVVAKEVEFAMTPEQTRSCMVRGDTPELWFCQDLRGYAWVFRKGHYLNIGLGREDSHRLGDHLQEFVRSMQDAGRIPTDLPGRFQGHAYLLYDHAPRPLLDNGLLVIGDAAGLAYTQSGEGIRPAVESALMASDVICQAKDYSRDGLAPYGQKLQARYGQRQQPGQRSLELPAWAKAHVAPALMRSHWFTRKIVTQRWFLHEHVPALGST
ncbi:MAG: NAD(P)/FAD-dependent oxidoreductase [Halomonadaceae bacterium]|nr:MAG: NAD(P)/FAD-dependent oxidoreductase [Halomonadaceae bacterium]